MTKGSKGKGYKPPVSKKNGYAKALRSPAHRQRIIPNKKHKKEEEYLTERFEEGDVTDNEASNIKLFIPKEEKEAQETTEHFIQLGIDTLIEEVKADAKGFIAIVINDEGMPRTLFAGDLSPINSIGSLEVAKSELLKAFYSVVE